MEAAALEVVAVRHLHVDRNLRVSEIEVADNDLLRALPLGLDFASEFVCYLSLLGIIRGRLPGWYRTKIDSGRAGLGYVVGVFNTRKLLYTLFPVLIGGAGTATP